jgi:dTDP-4-amino-4,6-dideoxygalactose transaminase
MVPFLDLKAQYRTIGAEVEAAILRTVRSSQYVLGPEVASFEERFADYCGVEHCVAVNSGTSALHLALLATGIGRGDEVITVPMTFVATTAAILYAGATPVFVDVTPDTWTMDPERIEAAITPRTKAILPVHLHGLIADMDPILEVARRHALVVIEDAAQAHGAEYKGRRAGSLGLIGCFSFYPGKNLGAFGEGGAAVTDDAELQSRMRMMRDWGQDRKYHHSIAGYNYRMDEVQGAVLGVKMNHIDSWTAQRRAHAARYDRLLAPLAMQRPAPTSHCAHAYHVYAVQVPDRDGVQSALSSAGIFTAIHYPIPVHLQPAYADLGYSAGDFMVSERLAGRFLSLPMFAELECRQIEAVIDQLRHALAVKRGAAE